MRSTACSPSGAVASLLTFGNLTVIHRAAAQTGRMDLLVKARKLAYGSASAVVSAAKSAMVATQEVLTPM